MLIDELNIINELYYNNSNSYNIVQSHANELLQVFKVKSLVKFKQSDIEKYIRILKQKDNKASTINNKLAYLSKCLNYYNNSKIKIPYQKIKQVEKNIITNDYFTYLLEVFKNNNELLQFINIAYYTGMRANEILNIRYNHIIKQNNQYFINIYETKNHKSNLIPITNKLNKVLENFQEFTYNYKQIHYILHKQGITAHQFRHTFITHCFESGLDSFTVMRLANQTSLQTTKKYVHLQNKFLCEEVEKIAN